VAEEVSGRDLDWFFDQFVFGARRLDDAISEIGSRRLSTPAGVFEKDGKLETISTQEAEKKDREREKRGEHFLYESWVKAERLGDASVPQEIEVRFEDGHVERRSFDAGARWVKFSFVRPSRIASAVVDPDGKYQLDLCFANNSRTERLQLPLAGSWTLRLLFWAQNVLLWISALA